MSVILTGSYGKSNSLSRYRSTTADPGFSVSTFQVSVQSDEDIHGAFDTIRTKPETGLIVPSDSFTFERANLIIIDLVEQLGKAAVYVDRILKGEKPGELPVQGPTRYTMTINLKTAKVFGLTIASGLIASADEVIK